MDDTPPDLTLTDRQLIALAGAALREAARLLVVATDLIYNVEPRFNSAPLAEWAMTLADVAHEFDPSDQRIPQPQEPTP
jgi:hypothetical protein